MPRQRVLANSQQATPVVPTRRLAFWLTRQSTRTTLLLHAHNTAPIPKSSRASHMLQAAQELTLLLVHRHACTICQCALAEVELQNQHMKKSCSTSPLIPNRPCALSCRWSVACDKPAACHPVQKRPCGASWHFSPTRHDNIQHWSSAESTGGRFDCRMCAMQSCPIAVQMCQMRQMHAVAGGQTTEPHQRVAVQDEEMPRGSTYSPEAMSARRASSGVPPLPAAMNGHAEHARQQSLPEPAPPAQVPTPSLLGSECEHGPAAQSSPSTACVQMCPPAG